MGPVTGITDGGSPSAASFSASLASALLAGGVLDELTLARAQRAERQSGERLDVVLTRLGLVPEATMVRYAAQHLGIPAASKNDFPSEPLFADALSAQFLSAHRLLPLGVSADTLAVATSDPFNKEAVQALAYQVDRKVELRLAADTDITQAIAHLYGKTKPALPAAHAPTNAKAGDDDDVRRLTDLASEAPVIRLVHDLIQSAVESAASDIHLEPREEGVAVRNRIDGVLQTVRVLPPDDRAAVISRIKIMAGMNIAERRLPQDGRIKTTVRGHEIDLRVSTMPTLRGESVVLRILDRSSVALDFADLGFSPAAVHSILQLLAEPNGIILVTGPTGSGKTTTLYSALSVLNSPDRKIFTIEDPIEYQLAGVNQIQVQPKIGLTFASALRSILRQDPDIIMVGEIRDRETADMAIQAALTGHLVLSTVHTNSAVATITRLLDMGVEDYLLASTVKAVLAQRLVRRLCERCASPLEPSPALAARLSEFVPHVQALHGLKHPVGCSSCRGTGFNGRTAINELLLLTPELRERILSDRSEQSIKAAAQSLGMRTLLQDGLAKAFAGETAVDEIFRVIRAE